MVEEEGEPKKSAETHVERVAINNVNNIELSSLDSLLSPRLLLLY
jgi:hypothetical protein